MTFSQEFREACVPGTELSDLCVPRSTQDRSLWEMISVCTTSVCWAGQEGPEPRVCFGWWGLPSKPGWAGKLVNTTIRVVHFAHYQVSSLAFLCSWLLGSFYFCIRTLLQFPIPHGMSSDRIYRTTLLGCTMLILFIFKRVFSPFFLKKIFLSNLYIQHGAQIYNPRIKSCMLSWLSHPGAPIVLKSIKIKTY